jgi:Pyridine nucleotide-disulphide oxidoreductase
VIDKIEGASEMEYLHKFNIFKLKKIPDHLGLIGFNHETIEVALFYSSIGVEVTIFEKKPLNRCFLDIDHTLYEQILVKLRANNVEIFGETSIFNIKKNENDISLISEEGKVYSVTDLYLCSRESFEDQSLGLKNLKIKYDKNGILTNKLGQTNVANIFAFGSCRASKIGEMVINEPEKFVENERDTIKIKYAKLPTKILLGAANSIKSFQKLEVPNFQRFSLTYFAHCVSFGITELEARRKYGPAIEVKTVCSLDYSGFLKIVFFEKSGLIAGFSAAGYYCEHFEGLVLFAVHNKLKVDKVLENIEILTG